MNTWHEKHLDSRSFGDRMADGLASFVGSWRFVGIQSFVMFCWIVGNVYLLFHFDPFPFVFLNLFMSAEAAFSTPIIMMSQNRAAERDRANAEHDYATNIEAENRIEQLQIDIARLETEKLDKILAIHTPKGE